MRNSCSTLGHYNLLYGTMLFTFKQKYVIEASEVLQNGSCDRYNEMSYRYLTYPVEPITLTEEQIYYLKIA